MLTKSKSCPNLLFSYNKKLSFSYGNFVQLNPNATKALIISLLSTLRFIKIM